MRKSMKGKDVIGWLKGSNRLKHLVGGFLVGLLFSFFAALGAAGAMEFKDWQWGGRPDAADFLLTVGGGLAGGLARVVLIVSVIKIFIS